MISHRLHASTKHNDVDKSGEARFGALGPHTHKLCGRLVRKET
jgi:hypothetical protein